MLDVHTKRGVGPELDDTGRCPSRGHGVGIGLQVEDVELGHGELSPTVPAVKINCKQQHLSLHSKEAELAVRQSLKILNN